MFSIFLRQTPCFPYFRLRVFHKFDSGTPTPALRLRHSDSGTPAPGLRLRVFHVTIAYTQCKLSTIKFDTCRRDKVTCCCQLSSLSAESKQLYANKPDIISAKICSKTNKSNQGQVTKLRQIPHWPPCWILLCYKVRPRRKSKIFIYKR